MPTLSNVIATEKETRQDASTHTDEEQDETPTASRRRAALALADQLVVSGSNFLTLALVANFCTKAEVGVFHLAWTLLNFIRTAQERTLAAPYLAFVHRHDQEPRTLLGSSIVHQACFAVLSSLLLAVLAAYSSGTTKLASLSPVLFVLVLSMPFVLLRDHIRAVCAAHFQYHISLAMNCVAAALQVGGILILAYLGKLSIPSVALVLGVACLIPTLGWFVVRPRHFSVQWTTTVADWKQNWSYAKWLVMARSIAIGGNNSIPFLILFMMDEASAGGFGTSAGLVGLSLTFIMGANNFFQPRTIKAYHNQGLDRMLRTVYEAVFVLGGVLLAIVVMFAVAGGPLLGFIYGPGYAIYGPVTVLLSLGMLMVCVSIVCGNGLAAMGKPKGYFAGEVAYCFVSVTTAVLLIPRWGLLGAGAALVLGGIAASVVTAFVLWRLVQEERLKTDTALHPS